MIRLGTNFGPLKNVKKVLLTLFNFKKICLKSHGSDVGLDLPTPSWLVCITCMEGTVNSDLKDLGGSLSWVIKLGHLCRSLNQITNTGH